MGYYTKTRGSARVQPGIFELPQKYICDDFWLVNHYCITMPQDEWKAYYVEENAKKLLREFPDQYFYGVFECEGEENGDRWDLIFEGRRVFIQQYKLVPDGDKKELV